MTGEVTRCGLDVCQSVSGNWFGLIGSAVVIWAIWRWAP